MIRKIIKYLLRINYCKKKVKIGSNTRILCSWLNFGTEPYLIEIGSNCTITSGVRFLTHDGSIDTFFYINRENRWFGEKKFEKLGKIIIEDNCFVGVNAIILQNVRIGKNSIIGAGAVIAKDIPSNSIVVGNPARIIGNTKEKAAKIKENLLLIDHRNKERDILKKI